MKLASLKAGGRDGTLVVVDCALTRAIAVPHIARTLQSAIEHWDVLAPELQAVSDRLNAGKLADEIAFDPAQAAAPLPRAYQWVDGSAYVVHVELVRKARGVELPENFWTDPLMYQGGSDKFIGPTDDIEATSEDWGIDFEAEVCVIVDDVPMGTTAVQAKDHIKLVLLANDVSARLLIPNELNKGFGFLHGKPATAFSPVAVTPDEFGDAWDGTRVKLPLVSTYNGKPFGRPEAGVDMTFDFPTLVAHAATTRHLGAGTIVGSGTVANRDRSVGSSCLAERRMIETIEQGKP
ncbi:MAG: fumarylacetoacetate hydrolase family protein, partial [Reyranellaceae bacterium]